MIACNHENLRSVSAAKSGVTSLDSHLGSLVSVRSKRFEMPLPARRLSPGPAPFRESPERGRPDGPVKAVVQARAGHRLAGMRLEPSGRAGPGSFGRLLRGRLERRKWSANGLPSCGIPAPNEPNPVLVESSPTH